MKINKELFTEINPKLAALFGDMAIKDLSPKDANSGGRIIKNMRICGSGLYEYHVSEAPLMGLCIPEAYTGDTFKIFRSPEVLIANKDLYARVPIITGHHVRVNTSNAKQLAVGMVGDTVQYEVDKQDGETYLYTTGTIIAGDGIDAYEKYGELSVGYDPIVEWCPGDYKGQQYQAVLKGFNEINHLLICQTARGGHQCMIMDSMPSIKKAEDNKDGGKAMEFFKRIFAKPAEKPIAGDAKVASAMLQSVKVGADCKTQVLAVQQMLGDRADDTLKAYFEELTGDEVSKAPKEKIAEAIDIVDAAVQKAFGDADECGSAKDPGDADDKGTKSADDKTKADEKPEDAKKSETSAGDEVFTKADVEKMIGDAIAKALADEKQKHQKSAEEADNSFEQSRLDALMTGDETGAKSHTSDDLLKEIWG